MFPFQEKPIFAVFPLRLWLSGRRGLTFGRCRYLCAALSCFGTATVFSDTAVAIIAGGLKFTADKLADVKITKSLSGGTLPIGGVCTSELSFTLRNEDGVVFDESGTVTIEDCPGEYPTYYINQRSGGKLRENYVCYDAMVFSEKKFEYDWTAETVAKDERGRKYITSGQFLVLAASQMGVSGIGGGSTEIKLLKKHIKGKTIKDVLSMLACAWGGCFYVASSGGIQFAAYGGYSAVCNIDGCDHSAVNIGFERSPVSRVIMPDSDKNKVYATLGSTDFSAIIRVSSPMASQELAEAILGNASNYRYKAFTCAKAIVNDNIEAGSLVSFGENSFIAYSVTLFLTASGVYASLSAPEISESENCFNGALQREVSGKITLGRQYENFIYNDGGLSFDFSEE